MEPCDCRVDGRRTDTGSQQRRPHKLQAQVSEHFLQYRPKLGANPPRPTHHLLTYLSIFSIVQHDGHALNEQMPSKRWRETGDNVAPSPLSPQVGGIYPSWEHTLTATRRHGLADLSLLPPNKSMHIDRYPPLQDEAPECLALTTQATSAPWVWDVLSTKG